MKKAELVNKTAAVFNRAKFRVEKYSPEILMAAGIAGIVVSAVMACRATTKISGILEKTKEDVDTIHNCTAEGYTPEDMKKDLAITYIHTGVDLSKLYAPAVAVGMFSIAGILASHKIQHSRNVALSAALTSVSRSYADYRSRVVERFGEAVDKELKYNVKAKKFEETTTDEETGKEKKMKTAVNVSELNTENDYAKFFDASSRYWEDNPEYNLMFLRAQQNYANDKLRANGHLYLNEVYDMLDIPRTKAGQIVGWVYDPEHPVGDNFVDFRIYETNKESNRRFVNGYEPTILLDFNVDGNILQLM